MSPEGECRDIDPPEHTRIRALVSKAFTPRSVATLRSRVEQVTAGLLDAVAGKDRFDLMAEIAYPLPVTIIAEMLGVRPRDMDRFEQWSHALALSVDPLLGRDQIQLIKSAAEQVYERDLLTALEAMDGQDLCSSAVASRSGRNLAAVGRRSLRSGRRRHYDP